MPGHPAGGDTPDEAEIGIAVVDCSGQCVGGKVSGSLSTIGDRDPTPT